MELAKEEISRSREQHSPGIEPPKYSQLIFDKDQRQSNGAKIVSSQMVGTTGYLQAQTTTYLDTDLTSFAKMHSKLTTYLNTK